MAWLGAWGIDEKGTARGVVTTFFFNHTIEICLQCGVFPPPLLFRLGSCLHLHFLRGLFCCSVGLCLEKMQKVLILSAVEMLDLGWGGLL